MVNQLVRIYGDSASPSFTKSEDRVKEETVFYGDISGRAREENGRSLRGKPYWRRGYNPRGRLPHRASGGYRDDIGIQNKDYGEPSGRQSQRKLNPVDHNGNTSRCNICESKFHWARNCPDADKNQNSDPEKETETLNLFQSPNHNIVEMKVFVGETLSSAVLDSGCT